jgi:hypothetical protein
VYLDRGGGVSFCVYFCGSLLSTQKRAWKNRYLKTKKTNEIIELNIIIRDRSE